MAASPLPPELASFIESLPEPHIVFDRRYRIVAANAAYRAQFSPQREVVGRTCHDVSHHFDVPCDEAGESCPLAASIATGQRERVLHLHHTPAGEAYVNIELAPLRDGSGSVALFIEKMEPLRVARSQPSARGLIGRSAAFQAMLSMVARVGRSEASVLLLGESGTGKELVARAVHEASARAARSLVVVDCASLPETLFESELFGHEKGAFTGAQAARPGLVEAASGGTLFLDEVGDIALPMQVKLLRLLESGTFRRVGSTTLRRADVRLISATHRDLPAMLADGRFRADLYYRLSTFPIELPPLRDRREDMPLLATSLLSRVAQGRRLRLTPGALARLAAHDFPGNVRELRNVLERASLLADGEEIVEAVLDQALRMGANLKHARARPCSDRAVGGERPVDGADGVDGVDAVGGLTSDASRDLVQVLRRHGGRREDAARALGISLRTLYRRLRALRESGAA